MFYEGGQRNAGWLIVGGGLAGSLLAARLRLLAPQVQVALLEQGDRIGGAQEKTWSFFSSDLDVERSHSWILPLIERTWAGYEVRFPAYERELKSGYHSIRSSAFHERLEPMLADVIRFNTKVRGIEGNRVTLDDGSSLYADVVIDARGWEDRGGRSGFQKFTGLDLRLSRPHGLKNPVVMDAAVEQSDGYRFIYLLPWSDRELLVEDTRYSDSAKLDSERDVAAIRAYVSAQGWSIERELRQESGVLPVPTSAIRPRMDGVPAIGLRGGFFHPTTSYSFSIAVRIADELARFACSGPPAFESVRVRVEELALQHWRDGAYARLLNRMLFEAARPEKRFEVLQRFYRLGQPLIERFYAGRTTWSDRVRILAGKPPVPVLRAMRCLLPRGMEST